MKAKNLIFLAIAGFIGLFAYSYFTKNDNLKNVEFRDYRQEFRLEIDSIKTELDNINKDVDTLKADTDILKKDTDTLKKGQSVIYEQVKKVSDKTLLDWF